MLLRSGMSIQSVQLAWLTVAMAIGVLTILVAVWATRRGLHLLALTLCGLSSAALSPWAWGHHWVWLIPLAVFLVHQAGGHTRHTAHPLWLLPALLLPLTLPRILFLADPLDGSATGPVLTSGVPAFVVGNLYVLVFVSTLVACIAHLRRLDRINPTHRLDAHALDLAVARRRRC
jgi:alpha-1,2-mannosyltransferase